jgi:hypothetical protein
MIKLRINEYKTEIDENTSADGYRSATFIAQIPELDISRLRL